MRVMTIFFLLLNFNGNGSTEHRNIVPQTMQQISAVKENNLELLKSRLKSDISEIKTRNNIN